VGVERPIAAGGVGVERDRRWRRGRRARSPLAAWASSAIAAGGVGVERPIAAGGVGVERERRRRGRRS
jgi:hypothetical protein